MSRQRRQSTGGSVDGEHYELPVTKQGRVRLSDRLRETYLTPEEANGECLTQAVGEEVWLWVWSARRSIRVRFPTAAWLATRPYVQSIHRWSVSINRYLAEGPDDPGIPITTETRDGRRFVDATVEVITRDQPGVFDGDA